MDTYTFALILALIGVFVGLEYFRDRKYWQRIDKLLNRLQAKDYEQFRYFEDQYKEELATYKEEMGKIRKDQESEEDEFSPDEKRAQKTPLPLEQFEEDWSKEEFEEDKVV